MSDMKCPFCQQELECMGKYTDGSSKWLCNKCGLFGDKKLFDEIIRTRKALDVVKDTIIHADWFFDGDYNIDAKTMHNEIKRAIKGITALEQKGSKTRNSCRKCAIGHKKSSSKCA